MKPERPRANSLDAVAHLFLSSEAVVRGRDASPFAPAFAFCSLEDSIPAAVLTANIAIELARAGSRVLAGDTCERYGASLAHALGIPPCQVPVEAFWTGDIGETFREGPFQLRLLSVALVPGRLSLLRSAGGLSVFRALLRAEFSADCFLVNLEPGGLDQQTQWPPGEAHLTPAAPPTRFFRKELAALFWTVRAVFLLVRSGRAGLRVTYLFGKYLSGLFRRRGFHVGLFLLPSGEPETGPAWFGSQLAVLKSRFLPRVEFEVYGAFEAEGHLYRSALHAVPLCLSGADPGNADRFVQAALRIRNMAEGETVSGGMSGSLFEAVSGPAAWMVPSVSPMPLSPDELSLLAQ